LVGEPGGVTRRPAGLRTEVLRQRRNGPRFTGRSGDGEVREREFWGFELQVAGRSRLDPEHRRLTRTYKNLADLSVSLTPCENQGNETR
jgi:hypothetical protein